MNRCCQGCRKRHQACWDTCPDKAAENAERSRIRAAKIEEHMVEDYFIKVNMSIKKYYARGRNSGGRYGKNKN